MACYHKLFALRSYTWAIAPKKHQITHKGRANDDGSHWHPHGRSDAFLLRPATKLWSSNHPFYGDHEDHFVPHFAVGACQWHQDGAHSAHH